MMPNHSRMCRFKYYPPTTPMKYLTIILISIFLISKGMLLCAQTQEASDGRFYRHEISVGYTGISMSDEHWKDFEKKVYQSIAYERAHDNGIRIFGIGTAGISVCYNYHFNHRIAIGAMTAFTTFDESLSNDYITGYTTDNYGRRSDYRTEYIEGGRIKLYSFFILPSLKWSWMNCRWCSLYSKGSLGWNYQQLKANTGPLPRKDDSNLDEKNSRFEWAVAPIGWEIGTRQLRYYMEWGLGNNRYFQIGLLFRFRRY